MPDLIHTTVAVPCRSCGLSMLGDHERTRASEDGLCLCGICVRIRLALRPLVQRIESLEAELAPHKAKSAPRKPPTAG